MAAEEKKKPVSIAKVIQDEIKVTVTPQPDDLGILSYLVREVDCDRMVMPQARKAVGEWFHKQDVAVIREPGKARMRRLKQITDGIYEEFWTLLGSQG